MDWARISIDADSRDLGANCKGGNATKAGVSRVAQFVPLQYLPLALFLMPFVMHAAMLAVAAALGRLQWAAWLTTGADGLYQTPPERGWGVLTRAGLAVRIALNAIVGMIVVSALALFEEDGADGCCRGLSTA